MDKLYRVTIEFETVIRGKDRKAVEMSAESIIRDADDPASMVTAREIKDVNDLTHGWQSNYIPWGDTYDPEEKTIKQMLEAKDDSV